MDLIEIHLIYYAQNGKRTTLHDVMQNVFMTIEKMRNFMFYKSKPISFRSLPYGFRDVKSTLCYQLTLSLPTPLELILFHGLLFSWGCYDNHHSSEKWSLLQSIFDGHIFPSNCRGFWMFTPKDGQVFSSMCQHGVRSKRDCKPSFLNFAHIL